MGANKPSRKRGHSAKTNVAGPFFFQRKMPLGSKRNSAGFERKGPQKTGYFKSPILFSKFASLFYPLFQRCADERQRDGCIADDVNELGFAAQLAPGNRFAKLCAAASTGLGPVCGNLDAIYCRF